MYVHSVSIENISPAKCLLHIEHWYFVAVGPWMCLARLWLFLSVLCHISHLITVSSIITVLNSILQVPEFAIALSKPPLFSGENIYFGILVFQLSIFVNIQTLLPN